MKQRKKVKHAKLQTKSKSKSKMQAKGKAKNNSRAKMSARAKARPRVDSIKEKIILAPVYVDENPVVNEIVNLILRDAKPLKKLMKVMKELQDDFANRQQVIEKSSALAALPSKIDEQSFYTFMKVQEDPEHEYHSHVQHHEASSQEDRDNETSQVQEAR
ncbi:MAG: hypothetical protein ACXVAX_05245 [Pseudobdellovibrio sp.]